MAKKKTREERAFPVATVPKLGTVTRPKENPKVIEAIIRGAVMGAFNLTTPSEPGYYSSDYGKPQKALVTQEQIEYVTSLIESLQPQDAIEACLAAQFVIAQIRGMAQTNESYSSPEKFCETFRFTHEVLDTITKYRTKGAQLINVNYSHNQMQQNNYNFSKETKNDKTIEMNQ